MINLNLNYKGVKFFFDIFKRGTNFRDIETAFQFLIKFYIYSIYLIC